MQYSRFVGRSRGRGGGISIFVCSMPPGTAGTTGTEGKMTKFGFLFFRIFSSAFFYWVSNYSLNFSRFFLKNFFDEWPRLIRNFVGEERWFHWNEWDVGQSLYNFFKKNIFKKRENGICLRMHLFIFVAYVAELQRSLARPVIHVLLIFLPVHWPGETWPRGRRCIPRTHCVSSFLKKEKSLSAYLLRGGCGVRGRRNIQSFCPFFFSF